MTISFEKIDNFGKRRWFAYIAITITMFVAMSPVLIGGKIFYHIDVITHHLQYLSYIKNTINNPADLLWNPLLFSGFPSFVSGNFVYINPWSLVFLKFFSVATAYIWSIYFSIVLAGFVAVRFLQKLGLSFFASFFGGLVFVFSQWNLIYDFPIINSLYILPLLFLIILCAKDALSMRYFVLGSLVIGLGFISAHLQFVVEIIFAGALFSMYVGLLRVREHIFSETTSYTRKLLLFLKIPIFYFSTLLTGFLLASPKLISVISMMRFSVRSTGVDHFSAVNVGLSFFDLPRLLFPYDIAMLGLAPEQYIYIGVLVLFFAVMALSSNFYSYRGFFTYFSLLAILLAIKNSYLYWFLHHLPVFNSTRYSSRWQVLLFFSIAVLTAFGIDRCRFDFEVMRKKRAVYFMMSLYKWLAIFIVVVCAVSAYLLRGAMIAVLSLSKEYFDAHIYKLTSHRFDLIYYHNYLERNIKDILNNFDLLRPSVFFAVLSVVVTYLLVRKYIIGNAKKEYFFKAAGVVMLSNFLFVFPFLGNTMDKNVLAQTPNTISFLKGQTNVKIFDFLTRQGGYEKIELAGGSKDDLYTYYSSMQYPNMNISNNIISADMYEPMMSQSMGKILAAIGSDRSEFKEDKFISKAISVDEKIDLFASRAALLRFLGINYVFSPYQINNAAFVKYFETEVTALKVPIYIYHIDGARPMYYLTDEDDLTDLSATTGPLELNDLLKAGRAKIISNGIIIKSNQNTMSELEVETAESKILVFGQNKLPGWKAFVDGQETNIHTFGTVFQAIRVPVGRHQIRFQYFYSELIKDIFRSTK